MGVKVILEQFDGEVIDKLEEDFRPNAFDVLHSEKFKILKYIDQYDDTTFNGLMCRDLILDLEELKNDTGSDNAQIEKLIKLASNCINEPHTYLKFYGN